MKVQDLMRIQNSTKQSMSSNSSEPDNNLDSIVSELSHKDG